MVNSYCEQVLDYLGTLKDREECIIIDKDGNVWQFVGDEYTVEIPQRYNRIAKYDIHNHPVVRSFSKEDINSWKVGTTYLLTDGKYRYKAVVKKKIVYDPYLYVKSKDYGSRNNLVDDDQHIQCLFLQEQGVIDYERVERCSGI